MLFRSCGGSISSSGGANPGSFSTTTPPSLPLPMLPPQRPEPAMPRKSLMLRHMTSPSSANGGNAGPTGSGSARGSPPAAGAHGHFPPNDSAAAAATPSGGSQSYNAARLSQLLDRAASVPPAAGSGAGALAGIEPLAVVHEGASPVSGGGNGYSNSVSVNVNVNVNAVHSAAASPLHASAAPTPCFGSSSHGTGGNNGTISAGPASPTAGGATRGFRFDYRLYSYSRAIMEPDVFTGKTLAEAAVEVWRKYVEPGKADYEVNLKSSNVSAVKTALKTYLDGDLSTKTPIGAAPGYYTTYGITSDNNDGTDAKSDETNSSNKPSSSAASAAAPSASAAYDQDADDEAVASALQFDDEGYPLFPPPPSFVGLDPLVFESSQTEIVFLMRDTLARFKAAPLFSEMLAAIGSYDVATQSQGWAADKVAQSLQNTGTGSGGSGNNHSSGTGSSSGNGAVTPSHANMRRTTMG